MELKVIIIVCFSILLAQLAGNCSCDVHTLCDEPRYFFGAYIIKLNYFQFL